MDSARKRKLKLTSANRSNLIMTKLKESSPTLEKTLFEQLLHFAIAGIETFFEATTYIQECAKNKHNVEIKDPTVRLGTEAIEGGIGKTALILGTGTASPLAPLFVGGAKILTETTMYMIRRNITKSGHKKAKTIEKFFIGIDLEKQEWITLLINVFREIFTNYYLQVRIVNFFFIFQVFSKYVTLKRIHTLL